MGNTPSRRRRPQGEQQAQQQAGSGGATAQPTPPAAPAAPPVPQSSHYAQYPTTAAPQPQHQQPYPYYPQQQPINNGQQYYAGWLPGYLASRPPQQPYQQRPPPNQHPYRPYPHGGPPGGGQPQQQQQPRPPPPPTQELTQTATIRNAVNLKKQSLAVSPLPNDPSKLAISFTFDASSPCVVSTFVLATEEPSKGSQLEPTGHSVAPAICYEKGLAHKFPPPPATSASTSTSSTSVDASSSTTTCQHVVDLSCCGADPSASLSRSSGDVYPLVIRLETITEKGVKAGHTLEELKPGAPQQTWVQSQTTFAVLVREDNNNNNGGGGGGGTAVNDYGKWSVRVLKQKIWVEGVSYELQEIYGLEQAAARRSNKTTDGATTDGGGGTAGGDEEEERMCVICLVTPRDTTVLPCRHLCLCHMCAQEWRRQSSKCPICRVNVESLLRIRIKEREKEEEKTSG